MTKSKAHIMANANANFLGIQGCHAFVTGARGGIGSAIVDELLAAGCKVTAHDLRPAPSNAVDQPAIFPVQGDISDEASIASCIRQAVEHFGPIHILCANAGITNESSHPNIWELPLETWEAVYRVNSRGTFLTIKHFLRAAIASQTTAGADLLNLAIVVTGSECGKFGQAGHAEYASGKAGLQYGLVPTVKNEMVRINRLARINAVAPGWVDTDLIGDRLDDPRELYFESQGTVALRKIAQPADVARTVAFLASHRAAGHISGQVLSVDGGMEGRIVWREEEVLGSGASTNSVTRQSSVAVESLTSTLAMSTVTPRRRAIKVAISIDFDAISGWLGTGRDPANNAADYSQGYFSGLVGVPRLLKLLRKHGLSDRVTWCIPGHSLDTFPAQASAIAASGAEVALHGYAHEGAAQLTAQQERDVLARTMAQAEKLTGSRPRGYRAPLYQVSERTLRLLQECGFLWDSSLTHRDCTPYFVPRDPVPVEPIVFGPDRAAADWMRPSPDFDALPPSDLVEVPANWYGEDATPLQFYPHSANTQGYVDVRVVERMWQDRYEWLRREIEDGDEEMKVFSLLLHPDTSGMAHVIGMVERMLVWLKGRGDEVEFCTIGEIAEEWRDEQRRGQTGSVARPDQDSGS